MEPLPGLLGPAPKHLFLVQLNMPLVLWANLYFQENNVDQEEKRAQSCS